MVAMKACFWKILLLKRVLWDIAKVLDLVDIAKVLDLVDIAKVLDLNARIVAFRKNRTQLSLSIQQVTFCYSKLF